MKLDAKRAQEVGERVAADYLRGVFAKVPKAEIDLTVFGVVARQALDDKQELWEGEQFIWMRIAPADIRTLSLRLRVPETRISNLVEQCALFEGAEELSLESAVAELSRLASAYNQDPKDLNEGKLRLFIPNRFARRTVEAFLLKSGGIPETSFHSDHLVIRLADLLRAASAVGGLETSSLLRRIVSEARKEQDNDELQSLTAELQHPMTPELLKSASASITKTILQAGANAGAGTLFHWLLSAVAG